MTLGYSPGGRGEIGGGGWSQIEISGNSNQLVSLASMVECWVGVWVGSTRLFVSPCYGSGVCMKGPPQKP